LRGRALGLHIADTVSAVDFGQRLAVIGTSDAGFAGMGYQMVRNPFPERGMGYSIAQGVAAVQVHAIDAVLIALADMPYVPASHIADMLYLFDGDRLASAGGGMVGPPALFGRAHFPALCALTGDKGARDLLSDALILTAPANALRDVDTPDDLASFEDTHLRG
jgi:molybdenum cofactor cytidylyltransferase